MSAEAYSSYRKSVAEGRYERVYYFYGDNEFLKDAAIRDVTAAVLNAAMRDFNLEQRRGSEVTAEQLDIALSTMPMLSERRVVVLRDVGGLKKEPQRVLERYLENPSSDTVVVLVSPAGERPDTGLLRSTFAVSFDVLTGDRVAKWIPHHVTTVLRASITPEAVSLLQNAVGDDLPQLAMELEKLSNYAGDRTIDADAVSSVVGVRQGATLGDLLDRVAEGDARGAVVLIPAVLAQPKQTAVGILMAMTVQFLAIAWGRARRDQGLPAGALERDYFRMLKETGAYPWRAWGEAARCWSRAVSRWDDHALDQAMETLLAADRAAKEARVSSDEQLLRSVVLTLCAASRQRAA
jgi:DNA polymerase III subunit delta